MLLKINDYAEHFPKAADIAFYEKYSMVVYSIPRPSVMDPFKVKQSHKAKLEEDRQKRNKRILQRAKMGPIND